MAKRTVGSFHRAHVAISWPGHVQLLLVPAAATTLGRGYVRSVSVRLSEYVMLR